MEAHQTSNLGVLGSSPSRVVYFLIIFKLNRTIEFVLKDWYIKKINNKFIVISDNSIINLNISTFIFNLNKINIIYNKSNFENDIFWL